MIRKRNSAGFIALAALLSASFPAIASGKCGERYITITNWGEDWVSANLGVQMVIVNEKREASQSGRFLEVNTTGITKTFTVMIGGSPETLGPVEHRLFPITQSGGRYQTKIDWCEM